LKNYPIDRALRMAQRTIIDLMFIRPDTYIKPIVDSLPEALSKMSNLKSNQIVSTSLSNPNKNKTKFPKTWVT